MKIEERWLAARGRIVRELKTRGASRNRGIVENLRTVGARGLIEGGMLGLLDLILPEPQREAARQAKARTKIFEGTPVIDEDASAFLWLDRDDAGERIAEKLAKGEIDAGEAELLRHWARDGYAIIPAAVEHDLIDAALRDIDEVWQKRKHVMIDVLTDGKRSFVDEVDPSVRSVPHKLNDLYVLSDPALRIFMHPKVLRFIELVFADRVIGCNSLTFEFGSAQPPHIDHVYMTPPALPRRLIAAWTALEDVRPEAGPLQIWKGSHKLPPYSFEGSYHYRPELEDSHTQYLAKQKDKFESSLFMAKKGDVLLWHALFIHGGSRIEDPRATRKSMACHYFSGECPMDGHKLQTHGKSLVLAKGMDEAG